MTDTNWTEVLHRADCIEAALNRLPEIEGPDYMAAHRARRTAVDKMVAELAAKWSFRLTDNGINARFAMLGFRASATTGAASALSNWVAQVRATAKAAGT